MTGPDALTEFVARTLDRPAPPDVRRLAQEIAERPGVAAVLFYGNRLRDPAAGGLADLYVLTDSDRAWSGAGLAALGCRLLPPNVYHLRLRPPVIPANSASTERDARLRGDDAPDGDGRPIPVRGDAPGEPGHEQAGPESLAAAQELPLHARSRGRAAPDLPPEGAMAMPPAARVDAMVAGAPSGHAPRPALQVGRRPPLAAGESADPEPDAAGPDQAEEPGAPAPAGDDVIGAEHDIGAGAKVAVMRLDAFRHRMRRDSGDTTLWARFAQPAALLYARDAEARAAVVEAIAAAWRTAAHWADRLADGEDRWAGLFAATYLAELRPEGPGRPAAITARAPELYAEIDRLLPPARVSEAERQAARRQWRRRCRAGRALNALRLVKAAATYRGGAAYALDKIQRHAGPGALSPWERRLPWLAAPIVLLRLLRRGGLR